MFEVKAVKSLTWLLICLCVWASASGARDVVVCLGPDGHIALEPVHDMACEGDAEHPAPPETGGDCAQERHHADCMDILFPVQAEVATSPNHKTTLHDFAAAGCTALEYLALLAGLPASKSSYGDTASLHASPTPAIRYTVLLI